MPEKTKKILLIDDHIEVLKIQKEILARNGFEVILAANGTLGLEKARELLPDLVLTDVLFPGLSGVEVCRQIKQDPKLQGVPVIICSASDLEITECYEAGADIFLLKPVPTQKILLHIKRLLRED